MRTKLRIISSFFAVAGFLPAAFAADSNINAATLRLKVYKVGISTDPLCTAPVTVFSVADSDATYVDFLSAPTLGSGSVAVGNYPCVIIEFSDNIKYNPAANSTSMNCLAAQTETQDICRAGSTSTLIDGSTVTCDASENKIAMYLSTASTETVGANGHTAFEAPTTTGDSTKGFNLSGQLVVGGSSTARFIVNADGKIQDDGSVCELMPPLFGFAQ